MGGDSNSGKTTYINRIKYNKYIEGIAGSRDVSSDKINLEINNLQICFEIWGTPSWVGQNENLSKVFIKLSHGILLLFSLFDRKVLHI